MILASRSMNSSVTSCPRNISLRHIGRQAFDLLQRRIELGGRDTNDQLYVQSSFGWIAVLPLLRFRCDYKPPFDSAIEVTLCWASVVESTSIVKSASRMILRSNPIRVKPPAPPVSRMLQRTVFQSVLSLKPAVAGSAQTLIAHSTRSTLLSRIGRWSRVSSRDSALGALPRELWREISC